MLPLPKETAQWRDVDAEFFVNTIKPRGRPAVMKGLVRHWPGVRAAGESPSVLAAYLRRFYSGVPVPLFEAPPAVAGRFFYNEALDGFNFTTKRALLGDVLDRLCGYLDTESPPSIYAGSASLPIYLPGFSAENALAGFVSSASVLESIWIGNRSCIAPHFDNTENIACVVAGRRRFTLFPIDQIGNLYVGPFDLTPAGQPVSLVDLRQPELERHPRFAEALAAAEVAELEPGDAIYVPTLWWHGVEAPGPFNVLVNYWWRDVPDYFDSGTNSLVHCLLSLRSLPREQRLRWRALFDYLIFQEDETALAHLPERARGLFGELTPENAARIRAILIRTLQRASSSPPA
jgi:hypothetical protein